MIVHRDSETPPYHVDVGLTFAEVRTHNLTRSERWHKGALTKWSESDWGVALAGEVGEALNKIKKLNRLRDELPNRDNAEPWKDNRDRALIVAEIGAELADSFLYLDLLAQRLGLVLAEEVVKKFNTVSENYGFPERL
jgi:NTP pyrophosphatase (non-canonical NTP hydrolase)